VCSSDLEAFRELAKDEPYGWQTRLAQKLGTIPRYLNDVLHGRHPGGPRIRGAIAHHFRTTVPEMIRLGRELESKERNLEKKNKELESECRRLSLENQALKERLERIMENG
jgi:FtsZ-binding cell division protein ZapB